MHMGCAIVVGALSAATCSCVLLTSPSTRRSTSAIRMSPSENGLDNHLRFASTGSRCASRDDLRKPSTVFHAGVSCASPVNIKMAHGRLAASTELSAAG